MSFEGQIIEAIRAAMPGNADIRVVPGLGELLVGVNWKLNDDPDRPNKMSKTISIRVSQEAAEDFANASKSDQRRAFGRVATFLSERLAAFDPKHTAPKYESPPVEVWVITSAVVIG